MCFSDVALLGGRTPVVLPTGGPCPASGGTPGHIHISLFQRGPLPGHDPLQVYSVRPLSARAIGAIHKKLRIMLPGRNGPRRWRGPLDLEGLLRDRPHLLRRQAGEGVGYHRAVVMEGKEPPVSLPACRAWTRAEKLSSRQAGMSSSISRWSRYSPPSLIRA